MDLGDTAFWVVAERGRELLAFLLVAADRGGELGRETSFGSRSMIWMES
jgi:hypothetical protein